MKLFVKFNFGWRPFIHPPDREFQSFNKVSVLSHEEKEILPRPLKLEAMKRLSVKENACTLCFDHLANVKLVPCNHKSVPFLAYNDLSELTPCFAGVSVINAQSSWRFVQCADLLLSQS